MAFTLTKEALAAAYEYLCEIEPFSKWNMPPSEDVKFRVTRTPDRFADYQMIDGVHNIGVSSRWVGAHQTLLSTLAHELIHLHMRAACVSARNPHGKVFQAYADRICKIHEFDRLTF